MFSCHASDEGHGVYPAVAWTLIVGCALPGLLAALFFRGGLVLRTLGLRIAKKDGTEVSHLHVFWRSVVAWIPFLRLALPATGLISVFEGFVWKHAALTCLVLLLASTLVIWAALLPERGLHDRIAGTSLVPRQ